MPTEQKQQQDRFDQKIGYCILALIALILLGVTLFCINLIKHPAETRIIAFDQVGNLKIDDPVKLRGMEVGTIKNIQWQSRKILVTIETKATLAIHDGYHIDDRDIGVMGDRIVMIDDGDGAKPCLPKSDTLIGNFHNGISETVGLAWKLREIVDSFVVISAKLLRGTPGNPSFVARVSEAVTSVDSASGALMKIMTRVNADFTSTVDSIDRLASSLADFSRATRDAAPGYASKADTALKNLTHGITTLSVLADTFSTYADRLKKTGVLDRQQSGTSPQEKIATLHNAVAHLKEGLLKFQIYLK